MSKQNDRRDAVKYLAYFTQLGLSIAVPIVGCVWIGSWLQGRFSLGNWVVPVALLLGLSGAVGSFLNFYRYVMRDSDDSKREE